MRNWMTVRQTNLEFPDKGLVLVLGRNLASGGKLESVGSGKTALGEALCRALVGVEGRYSTLGHYSTNSHGNMYVQVETTLKDQPFRVELGHKCRELSTTGEGLQYTTGNAKPVSRGHVRETRQEINAALNLTSELAEWTVYIDGDRLKFNRLSERDSVNLLMTALQQPSWEAIGRKATRMLSDARAEVTGKDGILQHTKESLQRENSAVVEAAQNLNDAKKRLEAAQLALEQQAKRLQETIDFKLGQVTALEARQKAIKKESKELELASANQHAIIEKKKAQQQTKVAEKEIERDEFQNQVAQASAAKGVEVQRLRKMEAQPVNCPTCSKPWDAAHSQAELNAQAEKVKQTAALYEKRLKTLTTIDEMLNALRRDVRASDAEIVALRKPQQLNTLSYEYEDNEKAISDAKSVIENSRLRQQTFNHGPDRTTVERCKAVLAERQAKVAALQESIQDHAARLAEAREIVKVVGYWAEGFGPTGVPNLILREALAPLNETARRISNLITGGTIEIVYDTSRELSSGKSSSELVVTVNNKIGSKRIEGGSKGESGLINLIIAETLLEVGSISKRIGFRWYDEILNSQDQTVRRSILSYLRETANRLGILIFIVDHHQETASFADHVLVAEKTAKGTTFHWD